MLRLFIKSTSALKAVQAAGREMNGVHHLVHHINGTAWNILVREDGVGVMAPSHKPLLMTFMREHLLFNEAWGV